MRQMMEDLINLIFGQGMLDPHGNTEKHEAFAVMAEAVVDFLEERFGVADIKVCQTVSVAALKAWARTLTKTNFLTERRSSRMGEGYLWCGRLRPFVRPGRQPGQPGVADD